MIQSVISQLHYVNAVLNRNLDGVGHEASLFQPSPAGNSINWIVGHLVASYDNLLPVLGGEPVLSPEQKALYDRAAPPLTEPSKAMPFDELRGAFAAAHDRVIACLESLSGQRLSEPAPISPGNNPDETVGSLLAVFAFHQAYHAGQTGLARRLVGLGNALT